jgi:hypothetical protein
MSEVLNNRPLHFQMAQDVLASIKVKLAMDEPEGNILIDIADQLTAVWKDGVNYGQAESKRLLAIANANCMEWQSGSVSDQNKIGELQEKITMFENGLRSLVEFFIQYKDADTLAHINYAFRQYFEEQRKPKD